MIRKRAQAIVFDLDETLYRERRFALSGYAAVARYVEVEFGVPAADTFRSLARALRSGRRPTAFQDVCTRLGLDDRIVGDLVQVHRTHRPNLRLSPTVAAALTELRPTWALGVLTNGPPHVQRRKLEALGLTHVVDVVVFAADCVAGGKPHPVTFETVLRRLDVPPSRAIFVGDDTICDIDGANAAGMRTIQVVRPVRGLAMQSPLADAVVRDVTDVVGLAPTLVTPIGPRVVRERGAA